MTLEPGEQAPAVTAVNQAGETVTLDTEGPLVLYFYPRDHTSGCTVEANQFQEEYDTYQAAGVEVVGVSTDDAETHADFAESLGLAFDLLADPEGEIAEAFAVSMHQHKTARTTFVLIDGQIHQVYRKVDPDGHARQVFLDLVEAGHAEFPD